MTATQRMRFYFPAWSRVSRAMGWVMVRGRLGADLAAQRSSAEEMVPTHPLRGDLPKLLDTAERLSVENHRAVIPEDLRHAANLVASNGRTGSSQQLTNNELNRAVALFDLVVDPGDVSALVRYGCPGKSERDAIAWYLPRYGQENAVRAIAQNAFGTADFEALDLPQLRWLMKQIKPRMDTRPVSSAVPVPTENCPF
jgi:hypothetical protein